MELKKSANQETNEKEISIHSVGGEVPFHDIKHCEPRELTCKLHRSVQEQYFECLFRVCSQARHVAMFGGNL